MGNPLKLNDEMVKKAYEYMKHGNYVETVCQLLGISDQTYYTYTTQAQQDAKDGKTEEESIFIRFLGAVKRGESEAEDEAIASIIQHGQKEWTARAWYLERRHNARWRAKQDPVMVEVKSAFDGLTEDELRALATGKTVREP